ncbi:hypothetical protein AB0M02_12175 [Actinoplanes sp. NPDC051861]|uniref:hypothetical protein n=1 Tax=Actinoplanes sp. NPDC051861 TaxID=3155170 RepID=UPI00343B1E85
MQNRPPGTVTAAFWCQVSAAALLAVLALLNVAASVLLSRMFSVGPITGTLFLGGLLLALAGWLTVTAFGLRRGHRSAYWQSLTSLGLSLILIAGALGLGTIGVGVGYSVISSDADSAARLDQLVFWATVAVLVAVPAAVTALGLMVATVVLLVTGPSRRFFDVVRNHEPRQSTTGRYGGPTAVANALVAYAILAFLSGYSLVDSAHMMSNACFDGTGQVVCPISGPDWIRPIPGAAAAMALLIGLAGLATGRPFRAPALVTGYLLAATGQIVTWMAG